MLKPKVVLITTFALIVGLAGVVWVQSRSFPKRENRNTEPGTSPASSASETPAPSTRPITEYHCLDEGEVSSKLGRTFELVTEKTVIEVQSLECRYQSPEFVKDVPPTFSYVLILNPTESTWQAQRAQVAAKPSHRRVEGKDYLIADLNPVVEVAQVRFWGVQSNKYLELNYTPVIGEAGELLSKGEQLSDVILSGQP
jgi:hypothetical protein